MRMKPGGPALTNVTGITSPTNFSHSMGQTPHEGGPNSRIRRRHINNFHAVELKGEQILDGMPGAWKEEDLDGGMAVVAQSAQEPSTFENSGTVDDSKAIAARSDGRMLLVTSEDMANNVRRIRTQH